MVVVWTCLSISPDRFSILKMVLYFLKSFQKYSILKKPIAPP